MMTEDQLKAAEDMNKSINVVFEKLDSYIQALSQKEDRDAIDDLNNKSIRIQNVLDVKKEFDKFSLSAVSWNSQNAAENYVGSFRSRVENLVRRCEDNERGKDWLGIEVNYISSDLHRELYHLEKDWKSEFHGLVDYRYNDDLRSDMVGGVEFNHSLGNKFDEQIAYLKENWYMMPVYLDDRYSPDVTKDILNKIEMFAYDNLLDKDRIPFGKYVDSMNAVIDSIERDNPKTVWSYKNYNVAGIDEAWKQNKCNEKLNKAWINVEKKARMNFVNGEEYKNVCKEDLEQYKKVQYMMPVWLTEKSLSGDLTQIGLAKEVIGEVRSFADEKLKNPLDRKPFIDYANFIDKTIEGIESGKYNSEDVRKRVGCWESYSDCLKENLSKLQDADGKDKLEIAEKETVKDLLSYYPAEFVKDVYENFTVSNVGIDKNEFNESFDRLVREKFERNISKDDIRSRISDIKNCAIEFYSSESVDNRKNFYCASMLYELKHGSDIKTAEKHTTCKMIDCMFTIEEIKDTLRQCSPLASSYPIGEVVDSINDKRNKIIAYRNYNVEHCEKELGLNASCRDTYLKERNAAMSNGIDYYKADDVALGKMVGRFSIDEIKKTFRENSPLFVGDPHGCNAYVDRKIPDIKRDKERVVVENKLNVQAKEAQQLKKMAERADKPLQHNRKDFQWE